MTTRYLDPRAARAAAKGEAARANAEAEATRAETARAQQAAAAEQARIARVEAEQRRTQRAQQRRERLAAGAGWVAAHPIELLLSLIVVVPGVLAWSAMAAYGTQVYGAVGSVLPLFSEGAMWAFAFAVHVARRDGKPTGWLQLGVWAFAAVNATLNFLHGLDLAGVVTGLVMALVSVGGVIAHQLITAAPMRTRRSAAERRAARTGRIAARRVTRMERAAVRQAVGELADDGTVTLRHTPGTVTLARGATGRQLTAAVVPGLPVSPTGDELDTELAALLDEAAEPAGTAQTPAETAVDGTGGTDAELAAHVVEIRRAIAAGELPAAPSRRAVQRHLGVRSITAQSVIRVLRDDAGGSQEVAA